MDGSSLSTMDMEAHLSIAVEIGEVEASNDEKTKAWLVPDSDVGLPDEGKTNEGVGEPHIDDLTGEIGEPVQAHRDLIAEEPVGTAAGKDDEFGAFGEEPVEDSEHYTQIAEEDNSAEYFKALDDVDSSVKYGGILNDNEGITHGAQAEDHAISRMNTKSEVQNPTAESRSALRGRERKQRTKAPSKPHLNEKKFKDENVKAPEGHTPDKHNSGGDGGGDGGGIEIKHHVWMSPFDLLLLMWMLIKPAAGAAIPPSSVSYRCCTFEMLDTKIAFQNLNFTIKCGVDDICTHKPYADSLDCTTGSVCFMINKQIVKLCNKANNEEAFTLVHGLNWTTIHSSNPEELSPETVESLRIHYAPDSPTTSASPFPTRNDHLPIQTLETRSRVFGIAALAAVAAVLAITLLLFFCFPSCRRCRPKLNHPNEDEC